MRTSFLGRGHPRLLERDGVVRTSSRFLGQGRTLAGIALAALSLTLPWLGFRLSPALRPLSVPLAIPRLGLLAHVTYAGPVVVAIMAALLGAVRGRGRPTPMTHLAGWTLLATGTLFFVTCRVTNGLLLFRLRSDAAQWKNIAGHFGYGTPLQSPPVFGLNLGSTTGLVLGALRPGWYVLMAAGCILVGRLPRPRDRRERAAALIGGAVVVIVAAGLGSGVLAQRDKLAGINAESGGSPRLALSYLASAERLDPSLRYDPDLQRSRGEALVDLGDGSAPLAEYAQALRQPGANSLTQIHLLQQALAQEPRNPVIRDAYLTLLVRTTFAAGNRAELAAALPQAGNPAVSYALGRYYFQVGDMEKAVNYLDTTVSETPNQDVRSSCLTYVALSELYRGHPTEFHRELEAAISLDPLGTNRYARALSAGIYEAAP